VLALILCVPVGACGDDAGNEAAASTSTADSANDASTAQSESQTSSGGQDGESTGAAESGSGGAVDPGWGSEDDADAAMQWWTEVDGANLGWQTAAQWERYPGTEELQVGAEPHGARQNLWHTTDPAEGQVGYTVLKENYPPEGEGDDLAAVTIAIKRAPGYDPDNEDWFWARYNPDGSLFLIGESPAVGAVEPEPGAGCRGCHRGAADSDYLFSND